MIFNIGDKFDNEFVVSKEIYDGFINLFNDQNPLHTNKNFAVNKGFEEVVMHGNILNGFISYFIGEGLPTKDLIIHSQSIQYNNPVYLNDILHFSATVSGIFESVNAVEFKYNFTNSDSKIVAKGKIQIGLIK